MSVKKRSKSAGKRFKLSLAKRYRLWKAKSIRVLEQIDKRFDKTGELPDKNQRLIQLSKELATLEAETSRRIDKRGERVVVYDAHGKKHLLKYKDL
jgi:hypothetical protein